LPAAIAAKVGPSGSLRFTEFVLGRWLASSGATFAPGAGEPSLIKGAKRLPGGNFRGDLSRRTSLIRIGLGILPKQKTKKKKQKHKDTRNREPLKQFITGAHLLIVDRSPRK
jgi:hypothetical protein